jgi:hypothetical protein
MRKSMIVAFLFFFSIFFSIGLYGCKNWENGVVKNGIYFEKIHQSKGGTYVGYMAENRVVEGFPCEKGWVHFKKNWKLLSFQLSENFEYKNTLLPAHTWIHLPYHNEQSGYVCAFPHPYEVQGYICGGSGGFKGTQTGFYDSGRLRSFFPPDDIVINGVSCKASLFANINLHENGNLKRCTLAEDYHTLGKRYKKNQSIEMDINGKVKEDT